MKKITILLSAFILALAVTGCAKKSADDSANTMGTKLAAEFRTQIKETKDIVKTAETLAEMSDMNCIVQEMEPGYFPGFDGEITGFKQAVGFLPMIGSIPFVGYIFEVENPKDFQKTLNSLANPRWNICTQADETVVAVEGKYVFFTMCPGEE